MRNKIHRNVGGRTLRFGVRLDPASGRFCEFCDAEDGVPVPLQERRASVPLSASQRAVEVEVLLRATLSC